MKQSTLRAVSLFAFSAIALGAFFLLLFHVPDPQYNGRPLSVWLRTMRESDQYGGNAEINAVVQRIDAKGITALRQTLRSGSYIESANYKRLYYWAWPDLRKRLPNPSVAGLVRQNAAWMLCELKSKAEPALPELRGALRDRSTHGRIRELSARTLSELGPKAQIAVPELVQALNDPSEIVVECAARALGTIGPPAKDALSSLEARLDKRRDYVGVAIAEAVWKIDATRSNAIAQILRECIQNTNYYSQVYGSQALWNMRTGTEATVPVLISVLADTNAASMHLWSIKLLREMGTNAGAAIPLLETKAH